MLFPSLENQMRNIDWVCFRNLNVTYDINEFNLVDWVPKLGEIPQRIMNVREVIRDQRLVRTASAGQVKCNCKVYWRPM